MSACGPGAARDRAGGDGAQLFVLFWHLLTKQEDYAFGRPSLYPPRLRRLELLAGEPSHRGRRLGSAASKREQAHERELSERVEGGSRLLNGGLAAQAEQSGAGATRGRAS